MREGKGALAPNPHPQPLSRRRGEIQPRLRVTMSRTSGDNCATAAMPRSASPALDWRMGSSERHERNAESRRAAICGLVGSRAEHHLGKKLVAGAIGPIELRLVGGEAADQRARGWDWQGKRRGGSSARAPAPASRLRDLRLQGEPLVEHQRLGVVARSNASSACSRGSSGRRRAPPARRAARSYCRPRRRWRWARRLPRASPKANRPSATLRSARRPALAASGEGAGLDKLGVHAARRRRIGAKRAAHRTRAAWIASGSTSSPISRAMSASLGRRQRQRGEGRIDAPR